MFNNQELYERRMHVRLDRLSDPIDELMKGRYPDGLKGIGMGLGLNGQPLVDVSSKFVLKYYSGVEPVILNLCFHVGTLSSNNNTVNNVTAVLGSGLGNTTASLTNALTNANTLAAMNIGGMNVGLASGLMGMGAQGMVCKIA